MAGRVGVGPLFNADSCNACHNQGEGERGQGPEGDGAAPIALVIHLGSPAADVGAEPSGDPVYGRTFNTLALDGVQVEGAVWFGTPKSRGTIIPMAHAGVCACRTIPWSD
jgi:CxxC motif-containing protein (DUF1111 family)